jgi:hypothetical protein
MRHSSREDGRPADLWFWDDWFASADIKLCTLAAQGLWINLLGLCSRSKPKGTLSINGKQIGSKEIAIFIGRSESEIIPLMAELEGYGVYSKLSDGTIINRRMYRQSEIRQKRAEAGRIGGASSKQNESKTEANDGSKLPSKTIADPQAKGDMSSLSSLSSLQRGKNDDYYPIADFLRDRVRVNVPFQDIHENYRESWANEFRLMVERSKIPVDKLRRVLDWATTDDFWKIQIRSAGNFRDKFGYLEAKSRSSNIPDAVARERRVGASNIKTNSKEKDEIKAVADRIYSAASPKIDAAVEAGNHQEAKRLRDEADKNFQREAVSISAKYTNPGESHAK